MGKAHHPAAKRREMDTVCRDCGRVFAGFVELAAHYDLTCRPSDRHGAAGSRYRPDNVIQISSRRRR